MVPAGAAGYGGGPRLWVHSARRVHCGHVPCTGNTHIAHPATLCLTVGQLLLLSSGFLLRKSLVGPTAGSGQIWLRHVISDTADRVPFMPTSLNLSGCYWGPGGRVCVCVAVPRLQPGPGAAEAVSAPAGHHRPQHRVHPAHLPLHPRLGTPLHT
eukprot:9483030-Pyramimonas_sp.AAC.2